MGMGMKLFVGGVPWAVGDDELRDGFAKFGEVTDAKVITDRETGRSRGFGFVTFAKREDGQKAIGEMDGSLWGARKIIVNEAREREQSGGGGYGGGGGPRRGGGGGRGRDDDRSGHGGRRRDRREYDRD